MKVFVVVALLTMSLTVPSAHARGPGAIWSAIMEEYGKTSDNGYHCIWDTNPTTEGLGGWIFSLGADRMPADICFSLMRLMVMMGPEMGLSMNFHGPGKMTYFQAVNGSKGPTLQECGTMSLKDQYDKITPDTVEKILNLIKSKGAPAGMQELDKILNKNVGLTCVYS